MQVSVSPRDALWDAPFHLRVTGLEPRARVEIAATAAATQGPPWVGTIDARADARGDVDLAHARLPAVLRPPRRGKIARPTGAITVTVDGASTHVQRRVLARSVVVRHLRFGRTGLYGDWLHARGARRRTALLVLGGSDGGLPAGPHTTLLASHGYPVLRLAYFGVGGLPPTLERIPLEYFRRALLWLRMQPEVDPSRVVVFGVSRGGELALLLGSTYPELVDAVAAYVPSSVVVSSPLGTGVAAWTLRGHDVRPGPIPVERIDGPVFVVGAVEDALWPSSTSVDQIERRLRRHGHNDVTALQYAHAGHAVGVAVPNIATTTKIRSRYGELYLGGSPAADESARERSWPKLLRFLARI